MSTTAQVGYRCSVDGCDFFFAGEADDVKYARRVHELEHEEAAEAQASGDGAREPEPTKASSGGKKITQMANEERASALAQTITVRCADCEFEAQGAVKEARAEWAQHRLDEHDDDSAVHSVARMDREITSRDLQNPQTGANNVEENFAKTRLQGGGHAVAAETGEKLTRWTRDMVIEAVKAFHARHGRIPTQPEFRKSNGLPSSATAQRFGGLANLMEACGFEPNRRGGQPAERSAAAAPPPVLEPEPAPEPTSESEEDGTLADLAERVDAQLLVVAGKESELDVAREDLRDVLLELQRAVDDAWTEAA